MDESVSYTSTDFGENIASQIARNKPGHLLKHPKPLQLINPHTHGNVPNPFPHLKGRDFFENVSGFNQVVITEQEITLPKRKVIVGERDLSNATGNSEIFYEASPIQEEDGGMESLKGPGEDVFEELYVLEGQENALGQENSLNQVASGIPSAKYFPTLLTGSLYSIVPNVTFSHMTRPLPMNIPLNLDSIGGYQGCVPRCGVLEIERDLKHEELVLLQILSDEVELVDKDATQLSMGSKVWTFFKSVCGFAMSESEYARKYPWSIHLNLEYPENEIEQDEPDVNDRQYDLDDIYKNIYY